MRRGETRNQRGSSQNAPGCTEPCRRARHFGAGVGVVRASVAFSHCDLSQLSDQALGHTSRGRFAGNRRPRWRSAGDGSTSPSLLVRWGWVTYCGSRRRSAPRVQVAQIEPTRRPLRRWFKFRAVPLVQVPRCECDARRRCSSLFPGHSRLTILRAGGLARRVGSP